MGVRTSSPLLDLAPLSGQDSEVLPELDNLLRAYSTSATGGGNPLQPRAPSSAASESNVAPRDASQEAPDHPWSEGEDSRGSVPDSEQWHHPEGSEADVASMPDESDRIELALLLIQQLTDRVEELEARGADQKMSLGDTIVRLRRRVHILERGADTTATAASSRGVGGGLLCYLSCFGREKLRHILRVGRP